MLPNYSKAKRKFSIFAEEGPSLEAPTSHRRKIQANVSIYIYIYIYIYRKGAGGA